MENRNRTGELKALVLTSQKRVVDNAGFFAAGVALAAIPDDELYDQLMGEFPQWLAAARNRDCALAPDRSGRRIDRTKFPGIWPALIVLCRDDRSR